MSAAEKLEMLESATVGAAALLGIPLPQIVAVVQAAETEEEGFAFIGKDTVLTAALAALDEALTADGKTPK